VVSFRWKWRRRLQKWLRAAILLLAITVPLGLLEHWFFGELLLRLSSRWGLIVGGLLAIIAHPWFPWALIPVGILALILKEFLEEKDRSIRARADDAAALFFAGENVKEAIYQDLGDESKEWWQKINSWRERVAYWMLENDSPAAMMIFTASVTTDETLHHRCEGKALSREKERAIQNLEEHLRRFAEFLGQYRNEARNDG
jgi:hypothetical protein